MVLCLAKFINDAWKRRDYITYSKPISFFSIRKTHIKIEYNIQTCK